MLSAVEWNVRFEGALNTRKQEVDEYHQDYENELLSFGHLVVCCTLNEGD